MPILHPAFLLQTSETGSPKWLMWQDIQAVQKINEIRQGRE